MSIEDRIPSLTDKELASLQENATRLALSGSAKQKADCERVLPLIDAELAERKARAPAPAARKTAAKKAKAKA
jgi:hypothetical protein